VLGRAFPRPAYDGAMSKYLILACDGGGIRGYITASVIEKLIGDAGAGNFLPQVRLTAGTSTGSFIALALAAGKDIAAIKALYEPASAKTLFTRNAAIAGKLGGHEPPHGLGKRVVGTWELVMGHYDELVDTQYTNIGVMAAAQTVLGAATTLSQLAPVVVNTLRLADPSVTPNAWTPVVISNLDGSPFGKMYAWEAGMCSGAAPIYFPPYNPTSAPLGYCADGGLFANNPSLAAISSAIAVGVPLEDIHVLSFDTGTTADAMPASVIDGWGGPLHMGPVQWLSPEIKAVEGNYTPKFPLLSAIMDASSASIALNAQALLGARYARVTVPLTTPVVLDDASAASYATMDAALNRFYASPAYAAVTAWLGKNFPAGAAGTR
jgi:patatin-like phospholipase/acyl hydrolase